MGRSTITKRTRATTRRRIKVRRRGWGTWGRRRGVKMTRKMVTMTRTRIRARTTRRGRRR